MTFTALNTSAKSRALPHAADTRSQVLEVGEWTCRLPQAPSSPPLNEHVCGVMTEGPLLRVDAEDRVLTEGGPAGPSSRAPGLSRPQSRGAPAPGPFGGGPEGQQGHLSAPALPLFGAVSTGQGSHADPPIGKLRWAPWHVITESHLKSPTATCL